MQLAVNNRNLGTTLLHVYKYGALGTAVLGNVISSAIPTQALTRTFDEALTIGFGGTIVSDNTNQVLNDVRGININVRPTGESQAELLYRLHIRNQG